MSQLQNSLENASLTPLACNASILRREQISVQVGFNGLHCLDHLCLEE